MLDAAPHRSIIVAPSILSADLGRLAEEVRAVDAAGADWIQVDVMDGRLVPNITIGPVVLEALRRCTQKPANVHLSAPIIFSSRPSPLRQSISTVSSRKSTTSARRQVWCSTRRARPS